MRRSQDTEAGDQVVARSGREAVVAQQYVVVVVSIRVSYRMTRILQVQRAVYGRQSRRTLQLGLPQEGRNNRGAGCVEVGDNASHQRRRQAGSTNQEVSAIATVVYCHTGLRIRIRGDIGNGAGGAADVNAIARLEALRRLKDAASTPTASPTGFAHADECSQVRRQGRPTHAGYVRRGAWVLCRRPAVAGREQDWLGRKIERIESILAPELARTVAIRNYIRQPDCSCDSGGQVVEGIGAAFYQHQFGIRSHGMRPLKIELGLQLPTGIGAAIAMATVLIEVLEASTGDRALRQPHVSVEPGQVSVVAGVVEGIHDANHHTGSPVGEGDTGRLIGDLQSVGTEDEYMRARLVTETGQLGTDSRVVQPAGHPNKRTGVSLRRSRHDGKCLPSLLG